MGSGALVLVCSHPFTQCKNLFICAWPRNTNSKRSEALKYAIETPISSHLLPNDSVLRPGIFQFTKDTADSNSPLNSQQKSYKIFKKSAQHLELKRPSMPGTVPMGSSDGRRCNFCLLECADALFATIRSYAYRPISRDPSFRVPVKSRSGPGGVSYFYKLSYFQPLYSQIH